MLSSERFQLQSPREFNPNWGNVVEIGGTTATGCAIPNLKDPSREFNNIILIYGKTADVEFFMGLVFITFRVHKSGFCNDVGALSFGVQLNLND